MCGTGTIRLDWLTTLMSCGRNRGRFSGWNGILSSAGEADGSLSKCTGELFVSLCFWFNRSIGTDEKSYVILVFTLYQAVLLIQKSPPAFFAEYFEISEIDHTVDVDWFFRPQKINRAGWFALSGQRINAFLTFERLNLTNTCR